MSQLWVVGGRVHPPYPSLYWVKSVQSEFLSQLLNKKGYLGYLPHSAASRLKAFPRYLKHIYRVWAQERPGLLNCLLGENLKWRNLFHCNKVTLSKIGEQRENFLHLLVFFFNLKELDRVLKGSFLVSKGIIFKIFQTVLFSPYSFLKSLEHQKFCNNNFQFRKI